MIPTGRGVLSVAIPVHNEARTVERAVMAALRGGATSVLVINNASTDETGRIAASLAAQHEHCFVVHLAVDAGAFRSFEVGLLLSDTKYFAWLGGHDYVEAEYYERLVDVLNDDPDLALAYGRYADKNGPPSAYEALLRSSNPADRVGAFMRWTQDGAMFHGVYRTEMLKVAYAQTPALLRSDASMLPELLSNHRVAYVPDALYVNGNNRQEHFAERRRRYRRNVRSSYIGKPWFYDLLADQYRSMRRTAKRVGLRGTSRSMMYLSPIVNSRISPLSWSMARALLRRLRDFVRLLRQVRGRVNRTAGS